MEREKSGGSPLFSFCRINGSVWSSICWKSSRDCPLLHLQPTCMGLFYWPPSQRIGAARHSGPSEFFEFEGVAGHNPNERQGSEPACMVRVGLGSARPEGAALRAGD